MTSVKRQSYLFFQSFFLLIVLFGLFYVLEYGLTYSSWDKLITPTLLSGATVMMLVKKNLKRFVFVFSLACLTVMFFVYLFNLIDISKIVGNFGFSLLLITVMLYIPQIIKDGYIEKF